MAEEEHSRLSARYLRTTFEADGPNEAWFADITYVKTYQGWLYVAVVIDIWSRMVVGFILRFIASGVPEIT